MTTGHKSITLSPALDADGLVTSTATPNGVLSLGNNGSASGLTVRQAFDRNGLVTATTPTGAGTMTRNGAVTSFVKPMQVVIYSDADDSGVTFSIKGQAIDGGGTPIVETVTGPNARSVVTSNVFYQVDEIRISGAGTGNIEIGVSGYVEFTSGTAQHVDIDSSGNDSGTTYTITGVDRYGDIQTVTQAGGNAGTATTSTQNFKAIISISNDGAATGNVTCGYDGTCEGPWIVANYQHPSQDIGFSVVLGSSTTMTYSVESTDDDMFVSTIDEDTVTTFSHTDVVTETTSQQGNYASPISAMRVKITAFTAGTATLNVIQR